MLRMIGFDHLIPKNTALLKTPVLCLASPRLAFKHYIVHDKYMHMAAGLGRVKRAFITGRIIKQFFTPEARKVKNFCSLKCRPGVPNKREHKTARNRLREI